MKIKTLDCPVCGCKTRLAFSYDFLSIEKITKEGEIKYFPQKYSKQKTWQVVCEGCLLTSHPCSNKKVALDMWNGKIKSNMEVKK